METFIGKIFYTNGSETEYTVGYLIADNLDSAKKQIIKDSPVAWKNLTSRAETKYITFLKLILYRMNGSEYEIEWKP